MQIQCLVKTKSKTDQVFVLADGSLRIKIKALPVDGKANEYLIKYLARVFDVPANCVQIISGFTSSHKRINIAAEEEKIKAILQNL